ncbi:hypothetical protein EBZ37_07090 [bacterium]|nr:hypothetical protein [bacterium]
MKKRSILISALFLALILGAVLGTLKIQQEAQDNNHTLSDKQESPAPSSKSKANAVQEELPPPAKAVMDSFSSPAQVVAQSASGEFKKLTQTTLNSLVQQEELRKLSTEELHTFPQILLKSAVELGKIAEKITKDPSLVPEAIEFYSRCAGAREIAQSIRALCLARYQHHSRATKGDHQALPAGDIPESVIQLAEHVKFQ